MGPYIASEWCRSSENQLEVRKIRLEGWNFQPLPSLSPRPLPLRIGD